MDTANITFDKKVWQTVRMEKEVIDKGKLKAKASNLKFSDYVEKLIIEDLINSEGANNEKV